MAVADLATYQALENAPWMQLHSTKAAQAGLTSSLWMSSWTLAATAGASPGAAATCSSTTTGALATPWFANPSANMYLARVLAQQEFPGALMLYDRLANVSSLSGTVTTLNSFSLTLPARQSTYPGVMMALEIYTTIGATAQTLTVTYTNQTPTGSKTTTTQIGGTGYRTARSFIPIPLASGDYGIKSVESCQIGVSTGTAGDYGITLYRPLAIIPVLGYGQPTVLDELIGGGGNVVQIPNDACLAIAEQESSVGAFAASFTVIEA